MSKENYLLKETLTENVVRLYAVDGGAVAIGPSAHRLEKLTGGKYKVTHRRVQEIDAPAIYIPTEELLKNYASQLVAGDEPGVYAIAGEAVQRAPAAKGANYEEAKDIAYKQQIPAHAGDTPVLEPFILIKR
jgi:hypothetical protein